MFIHPQNLDISSEPLAGYLPLIESNPAEIDYYTVHGSPVFTFFDDRVEFTHYVQKHLDTIKQERIDTINLQFELDSQSGFTALGHEFDSDEKSLFRLLAAYSFAENNPQYQTSWIAKNNQVLQLTNAQVIEVGVTAMAFQTQLIVGRRMAKDVILACQSLEELLAL